MSRMALFLLILFLLPCMVLGQNQPLAQPQQQQTVTATQQASATPAAKPRLKIGLALEGGGALGLAHVGVLQWFEEHHIPVDYVAGTSMGGLVGGFYAAGLTPEELRTLVTHMDWKEIQNDETPYQDLSFRRKEDQRAYPNALILGLRHGISLPAGINAGHQIGLVIDRETLSYNGLPSFDDLPIPFRAVATDLVTGKEHVFENGSLAEALRATISVPGILTPVHDGNHVYVDGGLVNNLPSDVVRQMGADIVIAVHLQTQEPKAQEIQSVFNVLEQSIRTVVSSSEVRGMEQADAVVSVDMGSSTMEDFRQSVPLMDKGYQAAQEKSKMLSMFALNDAAWADYLAQRNARKRTDVPVPAFITVQGTSGPAATDIQRYLSDFLNKPLDSEKLDRSLTRLTGLGRYNTVGYEITEQNGQQGLLVIAQERNFAPPTLQPAFEVDGSEAGDIEFTLGTRLTFMDVAGFRSEWRTDFLFGNTYGVASELYKPLGPSSQWFVAPYADVGDTASFYVYNRNNPEATYQFERADIGADFGYTFSRFTQVRLGYEVGNLSDQLRVGAAQFAAVDGRASSMRLRFLMDHTDDPVVPRSGYSLKADFHWYDTFPGASSAFPSLDARANFFQPITQPASLFFVAQAGSTFGYDRTGLPQFFLGGATGLNAYGMNELYGNRYYLFRAGYLHDLFNLPPLLGKKIYAIGSVETGKMYGFPNESKLPGDFTVGILAETSLGPFFVGGSVGDSGHQKWFFQLGRVF